MEPATIWFDAGRAGDACPVAVVDDDRATQALRGPAAEFCAGQAQELAQEIVHRRLVTHLHRTMAATVDPQAE